MKNLDFWIDAGWKEEESRINQKRNSLTDLKTCKESYINGFIRGSKIASKDAQELLFVVSVAMSEFKNAKISFSSLALLAQRMIQHVGDYYPSSKVVILQKKSFHKWVESDMIEVRNELGLNPASIEREIMMLGWDFLIEKHKWFNHLRKS